MRFIEKLSERFSEGLSEVGQELGRLGVQGSAEISSALFMGQAYVPYGQGQNLTGVGQGMEGFQGNEIPDMQHENDGRSM
jgi:hypothetical protein